MRLLSWFLCLLSAASAVSSAPVYTACSSIHGCCVTSGASAGNVCSTGDNSQISITNAGCPGGVGVAISIPQGGKNHVCLSKSGICFEQKVGGRTAATLSVALTIMPYQDTNYLVGDYTTGSQCITQNGICALDGGKMTAVVTPIDRLCMDTDQHAGPSITIGVNGGAVSWAFTCLMPMTADTPRFQNITVSAFEGSEEYWVCPMTGTAAA